MADFKDIINDTIGSLADKARDLAGSEGVKSAVGKIKETAESTGVAGVYAKGAERARAFGQITKLTLDSNRDLEELNRVYAEIGKLYFEQAKDRPEGFFAPLFEQANRLSEAVRERKREIDALKAQHLDPAQSAADPGFGDFDAVVSQAEREATEK